jgi:phage-related protein
MDCVPDEDVVAWARDAAGRRHAKDLLESGAVSDKDRARLRIAFSVMAQHGRISNPEQFKKEKGEIWTFKSYQVRLAAFRVGRVWYLTHGFTKKGRKWPRTELERADRIRKEHESRKQQG